ncbi:hypothetical protein [uncultured Campylobacter sp.]|uniref:phage tail tube protein n=2 Tax=uncultured Campylobacter sp. TaxID=218934 RepID=UPI00260B8BE5|nr:hypothetical protein [uncultured Campylobacter sp.]
MASSSDYVTLGGGKLYIDVYKEGKPTGRFEYFGLSSDVSIKTELEKLEHTNTEGATQAIDKTIVKSQSASMSFKSDEISIKNLARAYFGETSQSEKTANVKITDAKAGEIVDLGAVGGNLSATVGGGGTAPKKDEDYKYHANSGIVEFLKDISGEVTLALSAGIQKEKMSAFKNSKLECALMFIGEAATGSAMKATFYKCSLRADGDFALKGDDWLSISFSVDILKDETRAAGNQFFEICAL